MLIDCQTCPVREVHCAECMVTALTLGAPEARRAESVPLDAPEERAVSVLLSAGLVSRATAAAAQALLEPPVARRHRGRRAAG